MSEEQKDLVIRAYLGICSLKRCYAKWGTDFEVGRTADLLKEMGETFPFIPEHVGKMAGNRSAVRNPKPSRIS